MEATSHLAANDDGDTPKHTSQSVLRSVVESPAISVVMSLFTVWALFGNDIRLSGTSKEADYAFLVIISIIFFCFILEILAACYYKEDYLHLPQFKRIPGEDMYATLKRFCSFGSFYFWLDLVATLTLLLEV
jgi:hypothetical protein